MVLDGNWFGNILPICIKKHNIILLSGKSKYKSFTMKYEPYWHLFVNVDRHWFVENINLFVNYFHELLTWFIYTFTAFLYCWVWWCFKGKSWTSWCRSSAASWGWKYCMQLNYFWYWLLWPHNIYLFISQYFDRSAVYEKGWGLQQIMLLNIEL